MYGFIWVRAISNWESKLFQASWPVFLSFILLLSRVFERASQFKKKIYAKCKAHEERLSIGQSFLFIWKSLTRTLCIFLCVSNTLCFQTNILESHPDDGLSRAAILFFSIAPVRSFRPSPAKFLLLLLQCILQKDLNRITLFYFTHT